MGKRKLRNGMAVYTIQEQGIAPAVIIELTDKEDTYNVRINPQYFDFDSNTWIRSDRDGDIVTIPRNGIYTTWLQACRAHAKYIKELQAMV